MRVPAALINMLQVKRAGASTRERRVHPLAEVLAYPFFMSEEMGLNGTVCGQAGELQFRIRLIYHHKKK
jgi:hypothetical protein